MSKKGAFMCLKGTFAVREGAHTTHLVQNKPCADTIGEWRLNLVPWRRGSSFDWRGVSNLCSQGRSQDFGQGANFQGAPHSKTGNLLDLPQYF